MSGTHSLIQFGIGPESVSGSRCSLNPGKPPGFPFILGSLFMCFALNQNGVGYCFDPGLSLDMSLPSG